MNRDLIEIRKALTIHSEWVQKIYELQTHKPVIILNQSKLTTDSLSEVTFSQMFLQKIVLVI